MKLGVGRCKWRVGARVMCNRRLAGIERDLPAGAPSESGCVRDWWRLTILCKPKAARTGAHARWLPSWE